ELPVALLRHPDRRDAETEEARIEAAELALHAGEVRHVGQHQLAELGTHAAGGGASHGEHAPDTGVEQAFPQHALPDHASGAEEENVHVLNPHDANWKL